MKKFITLFAILIFSFCYSQNFEKQWNKIYEVEQDGLITTANNLVLKIYEKAKKKKDEAQIIKCFFFSSKYLMQLDEDAQNKIIANLQMEMQNGTSESKALFTIIYIETLDAYSDWNSYKLSSRTALEKTEDGNFLTWNKKNFKEEIFNKCKLLVSQKPVLEAISLEKYDDIFDYYSKSKFNKTNVYDYVVDRVLNLYFNNYFRYDSDFYKFKKEYKKSLVISQKEYNTLQFDTIQNEKLRLAFELLKHKPKNTDGIAQEMDRLKYITNYESKDVKYFSILNEIQQRAKDTIDIQNILLEKAQFLSNKANKENFRNGYIDAIKTYDSILRFKNNSNAFVYAETEKATIQSKSLSLNFEKYINENQNHRAFISYRNIENIKVSFYKINTNQKLGDSVVQSIVHSKKAYQQKTYKLHLPKDYFQYTSEILLPPLEIGTYLIYTEDEDNKENRSYKTITVSNLNAFSYSKNGQYIYEVVNRKTGKPEANCKVKIDKFELTTDVNGKIFFDAVSYNSLPDKYNLDLIINKGNDTLSLKSNSYFQSLDRDYDSESNVKVSFFLDRSIYRPGQKVFFKGIATVETQEKTQILPNLNLKIIIEDANEEEFKTFNVKTNEYGSFSGEFELPKNILTGEFNINAEEPDDTTQDEYYNKKDDEHLIWDRARFDNNRTVFKVEEYKRPKFEITFKPNTSSYKFDDKIVVQGNAKAFAGSTISNTKVNFEIKYNSYANNYRRYENASGILKTGETTTDAQGNFEITFEAETFDENPFYNYEISSTITDESGETRTNNTTIKVGKNNIVLSVSIPATIDKSNTEKITISSSNLNNQFVPVKGKIEVYFLEEFNKKFKKSPFYSLPETQTIPDAYFEELFPFEQRKILDKNELKGTLIFSKEVNTEKDKFLLTDFLKNQKSGSYRIVFSTNNENQLTEQKVIFNALNPNETGNELIALKQLNENPNKDGYLKIGVISAIPELYLSCLASQNGSNLYENTVGLKNNFTEIIIPINTKNQGFINFSIQTIFDNEAFFYQINYLLKQELPKLTVETETFRDKLQPGSNETWSFTIKENDVKTQAEALATMYDASLDQFYYNAWESNLNQKHFQVPYGIRKDVIAYTIDYMNLSEISKTYSKTRSDKTELIWFGFDINKKYSYNTLYKDQIVKKKKQNPNSKIISGVVKDEKGNPLAGANIKNGYDGVSTDSKGNFSIYANQGDVIKIAYAGMQTYNLTVTSSKNYIVKMVAVSIVGETVVITGALGIKKKNEVLTSANQILTVGSDLKDTSHKDAFATLQGKVSGLQIQTVNNGLNTDTKITMRGNRTLTGSNNVLVVMDGIISSANVLMQIPADDILEANVIKGAQGEALYGAQGSNGVLIITTKRGMNNFSQVVTRKNLNETAFFFPHLKTDEKGRISFSFTTPEALTQWKFRLLAHNQKAQSTYLEKTTVTQKDLMVFPNFPRFFREKDQIKLVAKISNLTSKLQKGQALLQLFDAVSMKPIDVVANNIDKIKSFTINPSGNTTVNWNITIPEGIQAIQYKIVAKTNDFSDGEENIIPVIPNAILVTESLPIWVRENTTKDLEFETFKNTTSPTLKNQSYVVEYTSNPAWLALQSLPYLMEFEHECAEQTFARFYANLLSYQIIQSNPKIASVIEKWENANIPISKFYQNEELKSIILAETPWVQDAITDEEKKKNFAKLLDTEKCKTTLEITLDKLKNKQKPSGGFAWFDGGNENEYITRHIISGFGHINSLFNNNEFKEKYLNEICEKAIPYLDTEFLKRSTQNNPVDVSDELHYLYARSFFISLYKINEKTNIVINEKLESISKNWLNYSIHDKAITSLILHRFGKTNDAKKIINSLKDSAANNSEIGMYWIDNKKGWYWYQSPIETQALLIEAFNEISHDSKSIEAMKAWLIKNKQNSNWESTKATTEAIYALLQGKNWLESKNKTRIIVGKKQIAGAENETTTENETGYIKHQWKPQEITKDLSKIHIENKNDVPGFGGVYWQYFENSDTVKSSGNSPLQISKELFLKKTINNETVLQKTEKPFAIGDLVTVRILISAKEKMEFVHLKDLRASCFEPINVLSEYKWQDNLGYYMSTKDMATHFFFDTIPVGNYVLEYDARVTNTGNFSNGLATIQSMYAPEFSSHTQGYRVKVD